ncbi:adenylate and guanylate cyclase catalytic domain-domain-containing protein [Catenaria anguillulae PL171]|uniref:Adenylate and guanylate cyclase catalytic domain-domain-containing protein n=1 Tax=Catenaria anguillulae PL171 TaxID=765915 RepID=A0A1Y2H6V5_9FUNG|nr:adenylate and guanylate cyclase catalytic domain-domain-containing protein [Catenaria anguillulae PL171]
MSLAPKGGLAKGGSPKKLKATFSIDASEPGSQENETESVTFGGGNSPTEGEVSEGEGAKGGDGAAAAGTDATKDFRNSLNDGVKSIFDGLRGDLGKMETRVKAAMVSSLEKDEMNFFSKQDEKELGRLRVRQDKEVERERLAFKTFMESREARERGKNLQQTMNFVAKNRDIIIHEQDKSQNIDAEVKLMLDDYRQAFEEHLAQVESRHQKKRKRLTLAFERSNADKKALFALETAHLPAEARQDRAKDFQFKMNHQKARDKKIAEHRRDTQGLEIRQMKEMFDMEIKSLEEMHMLKSSKDRERIELEESQRQEIKRTKDMIHQTEFEVKTLAYQFAHKKAMQELQGRHKAEFEQVVARQHQQRWARMSRWKVTLTRETGLDTNFAASTDPGVALTSLFMDPQTTLTRHTNVPIHPSVDPDPEAAPVPLLPSILGKMADDVNVQVPAAIVAETEAYQTQAHGAGQNGSSSANGSSSGSVSGGSNESVSRSHKNGMSDTLAENLALEEKERLENKLTRMREELKTLKKAHKEQLDALRIEHAAAIQNLEESIRERVADLKKQQHERAAHLKKQQSDELALLQSTQEKEAAMEENIRSAEHKMLMERRTLNSVLETVGDGIVNLTPQGIVTRFNARAEQIFGYVANEIMGHNVSTLQPEEIDPVEKISTYLSSETYMLGVGKTVTGRKRDGTEFPLYLSISEVKENDLHLYTAIVRDLTEEVAAQEADRTETERKRQQMETLIQQLARERSRSSDLIHSMLPPTIAPRLLRGEVVPPESFEDATIMFTEIEGFSEMSNLYSALDMVDLLDTLYCVFDEIILGYNVYKVETVGDSYVCVAGVPESAPNQASEIAKLALHFSRAISKIRIRSNPDLELKLKVGIHSGPVVAGVVGKKCSRYCLFGDTMNTASRMKSTGAASRVHMSVAVQQRLSATKEPFLMDRRGEVPVKGKGTMETFWLDGLQGFEPDLSVIDSMVENQRSLAAFATGSEYGDDDERPSMEENPFMRAPVSGKSHESFGGSANLQPRESSTASINRRGKYGM